MKKEKWVVFREERKLVSLIDKVADVKGINRSDFIREAIRKRLAELGFSKDLKTTLKIHQIYECNPDVAAQNQLTKVAGQ